MCPAYRYDPTWLSETSIPTSPVFVKWSIRQLNIGFFLGIHSFPIHDFSFAHIDGLI